MISVIIPVYNTEKYLNRCLKSVLNQTYNDLEVILVDDGSTDSSSSICQLAAKEDSRVVYYRIDNGGQGRARNYALDRANGDWISFVDSDDWIENDMLECMISEAEKSNSDIAICGWYRNHGFQQREQPCPSSIRYYDNKQIMQEYLQSSVITSSMCNKIYRSFLWDAIRFPEFRAREDMAILYKILAKSQKAVHIGKSKYIQFVRPGSTERTGFNKNKMSSIDSSRQLRTYINENYPELRNYVALRPAKYCVDLMTEICKSFSLNKNKKSYQYLYHQLYSELQLDYPENVIKSKLYKELKSITENQFRFILTSYKKGIKDVTVDSAKKVYSCVVSIVRLWN